MTARNSFILHIFLTSAEDVGEMYSFLEGGCKAVRAIASLLLRILFTAS